MLKKVKRFLNKLLDTIHVLVVIAMCISGYSGHISPNDYPLLSISGLAFPLIVGVNLVFLVFWIFFYWRLLIIPIVGLLLCYQPIRQYCPLNREKDTSGKCIKVLSFNVHMYGIFDPEKRFNTDIIDYIKKTGADIVCIQESLHRKYYGVDVKTVFNDVYPYQEFFEPKPSHTTHFIYSKYPILSKELIPIESDGNMSDAYLIDMEGDTVLVINNHLETYGLSKEDKENYENIVEGNGSNENMERNLLKKIIKSTQIRARQAETIADYLKKYEDIPVIVCGDFNDTPLSYVHHTICKGLIDTYVATGNGPGFSYTNNNMYERIDHILCSKHFEPCKSIVDSKTKMSDHNPIISVLKKRPNH
jgi:endonuclease/exonuclease/phosphatase family metal-dependent hydrolase